MQLNSEVHRLFDRQIEEWPLAAANYAALARSLTKKITISGFEVHLQHNPARIGSCAANMDAQTLLERPCFLCSHHLPPEQEKLPYTTQNGNEYLILCNPYPIAPRHFTIPDANHTPQLISGRIEDMIELAQQLPHFVLLYNGPKSGASAPDHFHFQAVSKDFLPIQLLLESGAPLSSYPVPSFVFESEEPTSLASSFHLFLALFQEAAPQENEPMLNLLCWKTHQTFYLVAFPRKLHRPAQFYAQGDAHILLSPGAIDLAGVWITPLEKDFDKLSPLDLSDIITQISISPDTYHQIAHLIHT